LFFWIVSSIFLMRNFRPERNPNKMKQDFHVK